jgi:hypothetical protein
MRNPQSTVRISAAIGLATIALALWLTPAARAQTYPDVAKGYWAYAAIDWVTNQGPADARLLDELALITAQGLPVASA